MQEIERQKHGDVYYDLAPLRAKWKNTLETAGFTIDPWSFVVTDPAHPATIVFAPDALKLRLGLYNSGNRGHLDSLFFVRDDPGVGRGEYRQVRPVLPGKRIVDSSREVHEGVRRSDREDPSQPGPQLLPTATGQLHRHRQPRSRHPRGWHARRRWPRARAAITASGSSGCRGCHTRLRPAHNHHLVRGDERRRRHGRHQPTPNALGDGVQEDFDRIAVEAPGGLETHGGPRPTNRSALSQAPYPKDLKFRDTRGQRASWPAGPTLRSPGRWSPEGPLSRPRAAPGGRVPRPPGGRDGPRAGRPALCAGAISRPGR